MNNDKVSIIVPIYMVEKYLKRCVDSLIKQTYTNLEIILVDDGSSDQCPVICDEYARQDDRIKVVHKTNGGLSDARNVGLENATGEYISFVDSDDWVEPDFIETLYENAMKEGADISIVGCMLVWDDGRQKKYSQDSGYYVLNKENSIRELLGQRKFGCMVCQKLYKKKIFSKLRFPVGQLYEDVAISLSTFLESDKVVVCGKLGYNYFQRQESIVNSEFDQRKLCFLDSCREIILYSDLHNSIYDTEAHEFYLRALMMFTMILYQTPEQKVETLQYLESEISKNRKYIWKGKYLEFRKKVVLSLICIRFPRKVLAKLWSKRTCK